MWCIKLQKEMMVCRENACLGKCDDVSASGSNELLCVGTRIKFNKYLGADANEDRPAITYANKGDEGEVTGHGCKEGYWVKRDAWPAPFGCERKEFDVLQEVAT